MLWPGCKPGCKPGCVARLYSHTWATYLNCAQTKHSPRSRYKDSCFSVFVRRGITIAHFHTVLHRTVRGAVFSTSSRRGHPTRSAPPLCPVGVPGCLFLVSFYFTLGSVFSLCWRALFSCRFLVHRYLRNTVRCSLFTACAALGPVLVSHLKMLALLFPAQLQAEAHFSGCRCLAS